LTAIAIGIILMVLRAAIIGALVGSLFFEEES